jgi:hypothetical protein
MEAIHPWDKFSSYSRKLFIISLNNWEISTPRDLLPYTLRHLPFSSHCIALSLLDLLSYCGLFTYLISLATDLSLIFWATVVSLLDLLNGCCCLTWSPELLLSFYLITLITWHTLFSLLVLLSYCCFLTWSTELLLSPYLISWATLYCCPLTWSLELL